MRHPANMIIKKSGTKSLKVYSYNRRRIKFVFVMAALALGVIVGRLAYIMLYRGEYYSEKADSLHERERSIKAPRGRIYDRNGNIIADNKAVCSISVIHSQIEDEAEVTELLTRYLDKDPADIRKKVEKVSSRGAHSVKCRQGDRKKDQGGCCSGDQGGRGLQAQLSI